MYYLTSLLSITISTSKLTKMKCWSILSNYSGLLKSYWHWCVGVVMVNTHLVIWMKPQEAAACRGVQPSLSPLLTSLPLSTRNCTISAFSSMQACQRTHNRMREMFVCRLLLKKKKNTAHIKKYKPDSTHQSESSFSTVMKVFDPLRFGLFWKGKTADTYKIY